MVAANPLKDLPLPAKARKRERVLTDDELRRVYRAAQDMAHPFGFIVLVCIHTGMRRNEAASLKWSYITSDQITLPPEITKNNTTHVLPNLIGENLALVPRTGEYLFPSSAGTIFTAWSKSKKQLDELSGVSRLRPARPPPHILPRSMHASARRRMCTEVILNHKTGVRSPLQRIYDRHDYMPQMRRALENYERFLRQLLENV